MALWSSSNGQALISDALKAARSQLRDRLADLEKAKRHVVELEGVCSGLETKVAELARDEQALSRGYIALMGDRATPEAPAPARDKE